MIYHFLDEIHRVCTIRCRQFFVFQAVVLHAWNSRRSNLSIAVLCSKDEARSAAQTELALFAGLLVEVGVWILTNEELMVLSHSFCSDWHKVRMPDHRFLGCCVGEFFRRRFLIALDACQSSEVDYSLAFVIINYLLGWTDRS